MKFLNLLIDVKLLDLRKQMVIKLETGRRGLSIFCR